MYIHFISSSGTIENELFFYIFVHFFSHFKIEQIRSLPSKLKKIKIRYSFENKCLI